MIHAEQTTFKITIEYGLCLQQFVSIQVFTRDEYSVDWPSSTTVAGSEGVYPSDGHAATAVGVGASPVGTLPSILK